MSTKPSFVTVRAPAESVWQSVVENVARREEKKLASERKLGTKKGMVAPSLRDAEDQRRHLQALVGAAHEQVFEAEELKHGRIPASSPLSRPAKPSGRRKGFAADAALAAADKVARCAWLAARLAEAKVFGTKERVALLESEFKFNVCDGFWADCVTEYVKFFKVKHGKIPYRAGLNNVLRQKIPANATIGIFGDWGTGMPDAVDLLKQIKTFDPDILIHLGDVYYSGTQEEMQTRFLDVYKTVFGVNPPRSFSLSGNHDMYSGGVGYYWLIDRLGQGASYFAIQNDDWLFIAMDTGLHDVNPLQGGSAATFLDDKEATWVNELVGKSRNQKIVLLSHHPLFTAFDPIEGATVNPLLLKQIQGSLPKVSAWFWAHEHRLAVYDAFQGLARGRCVGHGAIPVFADKAGDPPKLAGVPVHREGGKLLDMGSTDKVFKHGFAIMTLKGKKATVAYFRQGEAKPLWQETF